MTVELALFFILAIIAIGSALGMLLSSSTVYAALYLVLNFCTVAVFYILLNAPFIAMSQISVYAGAIMVLFLFVIMLLGTQSVPPSKVLPWQRPVAMGLALLLAAEAAYLLFVRGAAAGSIPQPVESYFCFINSAKLVQRHCNESQILRSRFRLDTSRCPVCSSNCFRTI